MAVSIKASERGLGLLDKARLARGWMKSQPEWSEAAEVAPASLKRLWIGQPIGRDKFIALCEAIGLNWQDIAEIDATHNVIGVVQKMKSLFIKTVELDPAINENAPKLDEATMQTLCRGWLHELFALVTKATEAAHPDKSFYRLTQEIILKVGTLYESQQEETPGFFVEVTVRDKPGSLHLVTEVFMKQAINISQVHIVPDGEGMAALKIYCQAEDGKPISAKAKRALELALEKLKGVVVKADAWELGDPPTLAQAEDSDQARG